MNDSSSTLTNQLRFRRMLFGKAFVVGLFLFSLILSGSAETKVVPETAVPKTETLSYWDALVLGLVEGITEYLPVSSTGHLILTNRLLGLEGGDTPEAKTLEDAANAYAIIIQGGAILAVVILYWNQITSIFMGVLGRDPKGLRLCINIVVAFMPAAVLGLLLDDWIEARLFGPGPVVIALIAGAILMLIVEALRKKKMRVQDATKSEEKKPGPELHELKLSQCLLIGFLQCVAMWPGTSRSMMTIVGGYIAGLTPVRAAEFSFLLGLITLGAASSYKLLTNGKEMFAVLDIGPVLFGMLVATISAALAVRWLVGFLSKHGLAPFAYYRIVLAILVALFLFS